MNRAQMEAKLFALDKKVAAAEYAVEDLVTDRAIRSDSEEALYLEVVRKLVGQALDIVRQLAPGGSRAKLKKLLPPSTAAEFLAADTRK